MMIIIIMIIILIYSNRKRSNIVPKTVYNVYNDSGIEITNCRLVEILLDKITAQLSQAFVPSSAVGPITIVLNDNKKFVGPSKDKFTRQQLQLDLPTYLTNSPKLSLINSKSTWDSIFIGDDENSTNPFKIYLVHEANIVQKSTGEPVCSNIWINLRHLSLFNFTIQAFASTLEISSILPPICEKIAFANKRISYPLDFTCTPRILIDVLGDGKVYSGYCVYGPKCNNPFESCFYEWSCYHDIHQACPNNKLLLDTFDNVNGKITIQTQVVIHNTFNFDIGLDTTINAITISNMNIQYVNYDITSSSNIELNISDPLHLAQLVFDKMGGKEKVITKIQHIIKQTINKLVPGFYDTINRSLQDEIIIIHNDS